MAFFAVLVASLTALLSSLLALVPTAYNGLDVPLTIFGSQREASFFGPEPVESPVLGFGPALSFFSGSDPSVFGASAPPVFAAPAASVVSPPAVPFVVVSGPAAPSPAGTPVPWFTRPIPGPVPTANKTPVPSASLPSASLPSASLPSASFVRPAPAEEVFPPLPPIIEAPVLGDLLWELFRRIGDFFGVLVLVTNDFFRQNPVLRPVKVVPSLTRNPGLRLRKLRRRVGRSWGYVKHPSLKQRRARVTRLSSVKAPLDLSSLPPLPLSPPDSPTLAPVPSQPGLALVRLSLSYIQQVESWAIVQRLRKVCSKLDRELEYYKDECAKLDVELMAKDTELAAKDVELAHKDAALAAKDDLCSTLNKELEAKKNECSTFDDERDAFLDKLIESNSKTVFEKTENRFLRQRVTALEDQVAGQEAQRRRARELEMEVEDLRARLGTLVPSGPAADTPRGPAASIPRGPAAMMRGAPSTRGGWRGRAGRGPRGA